jgi:DnaJ-class molecular chaperone
VGWALDTLGLGSLESGAPPRVEIQQRFRELLRTAHPDTGGTDAEAAQRIADLTEARRILLSS